MNQEELNEVIKSHEDYKKMPTAAIYARLVRPEAGYKIDVENIIHSDLFCNDRYLVESLEISQSCSYVSFKDISGKYNTVHFDFEDEEGNIVNIFETEMNPYKIVSKRFTPCMECSSYYGHAYEAKCDEYCEYAACADRLFKMENLVYEMLNDMREICNDKNFAAFDYEGYRDRFNKLKLML